MSDMVRSGAAWLAGKLKSSAGTHVLYSRGAATQTITATVAKSVFESSDSRGVVESWESRDFIFPLADLPFGEPQRGDRISEMLGGVAVIFEVVTPRGVPLFHADAFHQTVRVHTKRVDHSSTLNIS